MGNLDIEAEMERLMVLIKNKEALYIQGLYNNMPFQKLKMLMNEINKLRSELISYQKLYAAKKIVIRLDNY